MTAGRTARFQLTVLSDQWLMAPDTFYIIFVSSDYKKGACWNLLGTFLNDLNRLVADTL